MLTSCFSCKSHLSLSSSPEQKHAVSFPWRRFYVSCSFWTWLILKFYRASELSHASSVAVCCCAWVRALISKARETVQFIFSRHTRVSDTCRWCMIIFLYSQTLDFIVSRSWTEVTCLFLCDIVISFYLSVTGKEEFKDQSVSFFEEISIKGA